METDKRAEKFQTFWGKYKFVLLVLLIGMVLLAWPAGNGITRKAEASAAPAAARTETTDDTETRMEAILSRIDGVGELELMLTVESTGQQEFAVDTELRYSGQTAAPDDYSRRSETVVVSGSGGDTPVVARNIYPTYRGALVVCQGGGSAEVRLAVTQAVSALTGLSSDRITVVKCQ